MPRLTTTEWQLLDNEESSGWHTVQRFPAPRLQLKCDGTLRRTGGEVKGKLTNGVVASTLHTTSEHGVSSITTADATPRLPLVD